MKIPESRKKHSCERCGKKVYYNPARTLGKDGLLLCRKCRQKDTRDNPHKNPYWKGGRVINSHGYWLIRIKGHPNALSNGYVYEHRYVIEQSIGRYLKHKEVVHHINQDRLDNRLENLMLLSGRTEHKKHHLKPPCKACGRKHKGLGYCTRHYWQFKKHGKITRP